MATGRGGLDGKAGRGARAALPLAALAAALALGACKEKAPGGEEGRPAAAFDSLSDKGIGPVTSVDLGAGIDPALAAKGEKTFTGVCSACHKLDSKYIGPALGGATKRRAPEWIMNQILNTAEMLQKDPIAHHLQEEYPTQMSVSLSRDEARAVLEYLRQSDAGK